MPAMGRRKHTALPMDGLKFSGVEHPDRKDKCVPKKIRYAPGSASVYWHIREHPDDLRSPRPRYKETKPLDEPRKAQMNKCTKYYQKNPTRIENHIPRVNNVHKSRSTRYTHTDAAYDSRKKRAPTGSHTNRPLSVKAMQMAIYLLLVVGAIVMIKASPIKEKRSVITGHLTEEDIRIPTLERREEELYNEDEALASADKYMKEAFENKCKTFQGVCESRYHAFVDSVNRNSSFADDFYKTALTPFGNSTSESLTMMRLSTTFYTKKGKNIEDDNSYYSVCKYPKRPNSLPCLACMTERLAALMPTMDCRSMFFDLGIASGNIRRKNNNVNLDIGSNSDVEIVNSFGPRRHSMANYETYDPDNSHFSDEFEKEPQPPNITITMCSVGAICLVLVGTTMFVVHHKRSSSNKENSESKRDSFIERLEMNRKLSDSSKLFELFDGELGDTREEEATALFFTSVEDVRSRPKLYEAINMSDNNQKLPYLQAKAIFVGQINLRKRDLFLRKAHLIPDIPSDTVHTRQAFLCDSVVSGNTWRESDFAIIKERLLTLYNSQFPDEFMKINRLEQIKNVSLKLDEIPNVSKKSRLIKALRNKPLAGSPLRQSLGHDTDPLGSLKAPPLVHTKDRKPLYIPLRTSIDSDIDR